MTLIANDDDFIVIDGKRVLRDGKKITVKLPMMDHATVNDAALHRPGPRAAADAKSVEAFDAYCRDLGDAWRKPDPAPVLTPRSPTNDARENAYGAMVHDLENAWKGAAA